MRCIPHKIMKNGFALLLSLIVTSILLVVGLGVSGVAFREIQLSGFGNQSEIAFYAAETGLECGMYWDRAVVNYMDDDSSGSVMDESDALSAFVDGSTTTLGSCLGNSITLDSRGLITDTSSDNTAKFELNLSTGPCVEVEIKKEHADPPLPATIPPDLDLAWAKTIITATGYNTCDDTDPRRVGRVLELELNLAP
mgnify:CR=1 FL=1